MCKKLFPAIIVALLGFLLCFPKEALAATRDGLQLWLENLLPTLLPFFILTGILIHTGGITKIVHPAAPFFKMVFGLSQEGTYVFLLGLLCGYPMGAKLTADLYYSGRISRREGEYLLTFCNNPSPAFLITYVGKICLQGKTKAGTILAILFGADLLCMSVFRILFFGRGKTDRSEPTRSASTVSLCSGTLLELLDRSIMNGFETITKLGGYILLFSIGSACLEHFWFFSKTGKYLFLGILELTTGLHALAASGFPYEIRFLCAMCMSAFGGLCIMAQTKSVLGRELSLRPYAFAKCLNAAFTALFIFIKLQSVF